MTENERVLYLALPDALEKACSDHPWDYVLGLRDGSIIRFSGASYEGGEWVHIETSDLVYTEGEDKRRVLPFSFDRGLDIRVSDISWVADAPYGS